MDKFEILFIVKRDFQRGSTEMKRKCKKVCRVLVLSFRAIFSSLNSKKSFECSTACKKARQLAKSLSKSMKMLCLAKAVSFVVVFLMLVKLTFAEFARA